MAKKTLLEITQSVLSSMNSDSVNSISDLEEALQVAEKAKEVYEDLMALEDWEHLRCLISLESLADSTRPNYLKIPENVSEILEVRYDTRTEVTDRQRFEEITYKHPDEFIELCFSRDDREDNIISVITPVGEVTLFIRDDIAPTYWTTFDGEYVVFDSYDSSMEATLQQSKNFTRGIKEPTFTLEDSFIPDLPSKMFPAYVQEVTRVCSMYFREQPSVNDERRAFRSLANIKNTGSKTKTRKIRYGRN